ncbi:MAG: hypothetical protein AABW86_00445 [Candidatus Micrarchaeota archaeon]
MDNCNVSRSESRVSRSGQVATELMLYSGVFLIIVISVASVLYLLQGSDINSLEYSIVKETAESFSDSINLAVRGGQTFSYYYNFPRTVLGGGYSIIFTKSSAIVHWQGSRGNMSYSYSIAPANFTFNGCVVSLQGGSAGQLDSQKGQNLLIVTNNGNGIELMQPGCS